MRLLPLDSALTVCVTSLLSALLLVASPLVASVQVGADSHGASPTEIVPSTLAAPESITQTPLADRPGHKVRVVASAGLFAAPTVARALKIAVYYGGGAGKGNSNLLVTAKRLANATVVPISPEELGTLDLSQFDILVFAGGSGSGQAKAIGAPGLAHIKTFVKNGGGYLGICAGAYLACSNFPWSLGLMNAKTRSDKWARGGGAVALQLTTEGQAIFGSVREPFPIRYNNGPIIEPDAKPDLPTYHVIAYFRNELAEHGTPVGLMANTPAAVWAQFGAGRVLTISPHFEGTRHMENFLPRALAWLGENAVPRPKL